MGTYQDGSRGNHGEMLMVKSETKPQNPAHQEKRLLAKTQQQKPSLGILVGGYVVDVENHGMQMQKPASAFLVNILAAQAVGQLEDDDDDVSHNVN
ncbi:hypothetical protein AtubIFM55763_000573 [Aspergillus tubingensis]|uniref:Uncharacterized protein n=1 Tax=Aspergillus tubingensis TaxID=5068 RepID=A0A9W6EK87_ASPTU|nr:hypothetical protein AtubIFM54640_008497 [Aspergillus tubingensis]GLA70541.1 hypothetical protein AtubIFM55763_000573 [Aspergillus tubingensis]GLA82514.1 hypothetical protein AtubIFM56815_006699 [Aspergillus tubingensis]